MNEDGTISHTQTLLLQTLFSIKVPINVLLTLSLSLSCVSQSCNVKNAECQQYNYYQEVCDAIDKIV